jgi:four helix bundle protein
MTRSMISSCSFIEWTDSRWADRGQGQAGPRAGRFAIPDNGRLHQRRKGMNEQEEIMSNALPSNTLDVHSVALEAAGLSIALATRVPAPLKSIADQVIRSASSVPANLSEGHGRTGRDRMHHWRIAYGSAKEVDSHLRLLLHASAIDRNQTQRALELFDRVRAMTWRLLNPRS